MVGITIPEHEIDSSILQNFLAIFGENGLNNLNNYEKRKMIFDYLVKNSEYDFELLNSLYSGKPRKPGNEVVSVLDPITDKKGICNSFSYAYKLMLDKLGIPSTLVACNVAEKSLDFLNAQGVTTKTNMIRKDEIGNYYIPHMLNIVQNDDGTYSFDDITYAIFSKSQNQSNDYFDYDLKDMTRHRQVDTKAFDTDMLRMIVDGSKDTQSDIDYRTKYSTSDTSCLLELPVERIKSVRKSRELANDFDR